jgi:hypothetical protein
MEQERACGAADVAALLRRLAVGVERGELDLGGHRITCREDLAAIVDLPVGDEGRVMAINLRLVRGRDRARAMEVELSHPGG